MNEFEIELDKMVSTDMEWSRERAEPPEQLELFDEEPNF